MIYGKREEGGVTCSRWQQCYEYKLICDGKFIHPIHRLNSMGRYNHDIKKGQDERQKNMTEQVRYGTPTRKSGMQI